MRLNPVDDGFRRGALEWDNEGHVKTAPGTRSANCESGSQGLANRYEGAIN